ncbi:hypothetical protein BDR26DRAFT_855754 [Obelidium mucronatum]|nr:hypothetical protein BDR26DRAFT_855754 [Obelidium mucronatum]
MKKLPNSDWAIVLTSKDNEYFLNFKSKQVVWDMPDEIGELVGQIMAGGVQDEDENMQEAEANQQEDDEVPENRLEEKQQQQQKEKDAFDELADDKEVVRVYDSSSGMEEQMALFIRQRELEEKQIKEDIHKKRKIGASIQDGSTPNDDSSTSKKLKQTETEAPLTNGEKQSMFMDMLREADISPFSTWEKELVAFTNDPRFIQIPLPKIRKNYFQIYCKQRAEEIAKARSTKESLTPKEVFREFLMEILGTADWRKLQSLSAYDDFSRKWKKDSRFTIVNDDRDRKALFKDFVARLKSGEGERKKAEKKKIEDGFFDLLRNVKGIGTDSRWREIQKQIEKDKRYEAIATPIQREELFRQFLKQLALNNASSEAERKELERKAKEEASLREREEAVRKQKVDLTLEVKKSQYKLQTGESVNLFKNLLIDLIKSHKTTWRESEAYVTNDPRFQQIRLPSHELDHIFTEHTSTLFDRRLMAFHELINEQTLITTPFVDVMETLLLDPRTTRLDCSNEELGRHYNKYQLDREQKARAELEICLKENVFVRFHVKSAVGNSHVQAVEKGLKEAADGDEWRFIGLDEIKAVLKEDKRYNDFDCFAAERERIVFTFVKSLIEEFRNEKGGVRDSVVARNAGGLVRK